MSRLNLSQVVSIGDSASIAKLDADPRCVQLSKEQPCKLRPGSRVVLNDTGLEQVFGSSRGLSYMKNKVYTITHVDPVSLTYPEPTYPVEVDDQELNEFLLDDNCFTDVTPKVDPFPPCVLPSSIEYGPGVVDFRSPTVSEEDDLI